MPAEPRGSAHVATEATDTLLCRIGGVANLYIYALACMSPTLAAIVKLSLSFLSSHAADSALEDR